MDVINHNIDSFQMSDTMLFIIMGGVELLIIFTVLAVILVRSKSGKIVSLEAKLKQLKRKSLRETEPNQPSWGQLLQIHISETKRYLSEADQEQQVPLLKRIEFLESEIIAQDSGVYHDSTHWQGHCSRILSLLPQNVDDDRDQDSPIGLETLDTVSDEDSDVKTETTENTEESDDGDKDKDEDKVEDEEYDRKNNLEDTISADLSKAMDELAAFDTETPELVDSEEEPTSSQNFDGQFEQFTEEESPQIESVPNSEDHHQENSKQESLESSTDDDDVDIENPPGKLFAETPEPQNETENQLTAELNELQNTLAEKDSELVTLKTSLADKDSELTKFDELTEKLRQTELAHQRLNSCIADLEKDNSELQTQLEATPPPQENTLDDENQIDPQEIARMSNEIDLAQVRIESLHEDLNAKTTQITKYKQEIEQLQEDVKNNEIEKEKQQLANQSALAKLHVINDSDDPEVLTHQIEGLTNIIVKKSEKLSTLQIEDTDDDSEVTEINLNSSSPANSNKTPELNNVDFSEVELSEVESDTSTLPDPGPGEISQSMLDLLNSKQTDNQESEAAPPTLTNNSVV